MTLNKMLIIGNLGADPELRYSQSGKAVVNMRVAVNSRSRAADGEWQDETLWLRVIAFDKQAERLAEQLRKGHRVYAEGRLRARDWEAQDGRKGTSLEIIADRVTPLERRERDAGAGEFADDVPAGVGARARGAPNAPSGGPDPALDIDDIPF